MEDDIVVVTPLSESRKVLTGFGGVVIVELDDDRTLPRLSEGHSNSGFGNLTIVVSSTTSVAAILVVRAPKSRDNSTTKL